MVEIVEYKYKSDCLEIHDAHHNILRIEHIDSGNNIFGVVGHNPELIPMDIYKGELRITPRNIERLFDVLSLKTQLESIEDEIICDTEG